MRKSLLSFLFLLAALSQATAEPPVGPDDQRIDYGSTIAPLLSRHCLQCHGPDADQRQAGLRLDSRRSAIDKLNSGSTAIVPGQPLESELWRGEDSIHQPFPCVRASIIKECLYLCRGRWKASQVDMEASDQLASSRFFKRANRILFEFGKDELVNGILHPCFPLHFGGRHRGGWSERPVGFPDGTLLNPLR